MPPVPGIGGRAGKPKKGGPGRYETVPEYIKRNQNNPAYVKQVQRKLREVGFNISVDGIWGPQTQAAYKAYTTLRDTQNSATLWTRGASAAIKEYEARIRAEYKRIEKRYAQLEGNLRRHMAAGDLTEGQRGLARTRFWAGIGTTAAGGAYAERAKKSSAIIQQYEKELAEAREKARTAPRVHDTVTPFERFIGKAASKLNYRQWPGRALSAVVDVANIPIEHLIKRPYYTLQLLENEAIRAGRGRLTDSPSYEDTLQALVGSLGGARLISPRVRGALQRVDTEEERQALVRARMLETFGERRFRELYAGVMSHWGDPKTKAALRNARTFQGATPGFNPKDTLGSALLDLGFNMADPTIFGTKLRAVSIVDDALKASRLMARNPAVVDALTKTAADAAARAAERMVAAGVGDVKLLQQLVPSLKGPRGATTELAAALASPETGNALRYLTRLREATDTGTDAGRKFRALVDEALSKVIDEGMTGATRQAILKASLGRTWKPRVSFQARGAIRTIDALPGTLAGRGLTAMPYLTRQAKLGTLDALLRRRARQAGYLGRAVRDPEAGSLLRFADMSEAERASVDAFLKTLSTKGTATELRGLYKRIVDLPDSELKEALQRRLQSFDAEVAALSTQERGFLSLNAAQFARQLAKAKEQVRQLHEAAPTPEAVRRFDVTQDKLVGLLRVDEVRDELKGLRRDSAGLSKLQPITYQQAVYNFRSEMRDYAYMIGRSPEPRISRWTRAYRAVRRTFDNIPRAVVNLHDTRERAQTFHDYAIAMGASRTEAQAVYSRMARTMRGEEALKEARSLSEGIIRAFLAREGLKAGEVDEAWAHVQANVREFWRDQEGWFSIVDERSKKWQPTYDRVYDVDGAKNPVVNSQLQYNWHIVDPLDLRRWVLNFQFQKGSRLAGMRVGANVAAQIGLKAYLPLHHAFKFLALTLGSPRYVLRMAGMEERLRMWMTHGFRSATEISSKHVRRLNNRMLSDTGGRRWFTGWEHVGIENMPMHLMGKKMIQVTGHGLIERGQRGFTENLWHVLMFQVRPEDDFLHHLLMPHLWGDEAALKAAKESAIEALETTRNGRVYLEKAKMVDSEYADSKLLVDKAEAWLKQVMPNQAVVDRRLDGQFTIEELRRHQEWHPEKIWGDKYESLWRLRNPVNMFRDVAGRLVLQAPTTHFNRLPFAFAEFNKEFDALTASGFTAEAARDIASEYAIHRTNDILFDASVRSRFAQKFDVLFPFQQAREEQVKVWARLLRENPERALKTLQLMAAAFNAGRNNGIIVKDQYGAWSMRVPGSPALSRALGRWAPDWVPFKRGLKQLAESGYSFQLRGLLFVNDVWGGVVPRPGGPWWSLGAQTAMLANPDWFPKNGWIQKYLMDNRQPNNMWLRPEITRLWVAATGLTFVPWEPVASFGWGGHEATTERLRDRLVGEVGAELYAQWVRNGAKPGEMPTSQDVAKAARAQLFMWGIMGMFVPAATQVEVASQDDFDDLVPQYTRDGVLDIGALLRVHPEMLGFIVPRSKDLIRERYTDDQGNVDLERLKRENPEYWALWKARGSPYERGPEAQVANIYAARDYLNPEEWTKAVDQSRRMGQAWHQYWRIINSGDNYSEKERALSQWEKEYGDLDEAWGKRGQDYRRDLEFDKIMVLPPSVRAEALKNWQYEYNVSVSDTQALMGEWAQGLRDHHNPWMEARNTLDLVQQFTHKKQGLSAPTWAKRNLTLVEQLAFYNYMLSEADDIQDFNEIWAARGELLSKHYTEIFGNRHARRLQQTEDASEAWWSKKRHDAATTIDAKFDQVSAISEQQEEVLRRINATSDFATRSRLWPIYFRLKDRKTRLFAEIRGIQNSLYKKFPDLKSAADEVKLLRIVGKHGWDAIKREGLDKYGIPYLHDSQERKWAQMNARIQQDYVDDLLERLTVEPGKYVTERGESALKWDYLTEFQKDILRTHLSKRQLDMVKRMDAIRAAADASGKGGFRRFSKGWRWQIDGYTLGNGFGELAFAIEQFKRYNRRPKGMAAPEAELAEYKRLGDNSVLKAQYLRRHPRLAQWFRLGPMANMPAVLAEIVHNIMVKYGKWTDDEGALSWDDVAEIGFARTMLDRYNKRKGRAPAAYERWLRMPTGKKRFDYMRAHPEIERWLQAGPMANMPAEYREVVRDIMTKFHLWTERQDPLSDLIEQYFQVPEYAKQEFLEKHPEILAYWRAIRTGRDRMLFDLAQTYFAIQDADGKKAFLAAHPELQDYFLEERKRRYESFLNNVARYLGRTPELAESYLREQTKFIKQMLDMFGQRPLVSSTVTTVSFGGAGDRQRQASGTAVRVRST